MTSLLERSAVLRHLSRVLKLRGTTAVAGGRAACRRSGDLRRTLKQIRLDALASRLASAQIREDAGMPLPAAVPVPLIP